MMTLLTKLISLMTVTVMPGLMIIMLLIIMVLMLLVQVIRSGERVWIAWPDRLAKIERRRDVDEAPQEIGA